MITPNELFTLLSDETRLRCLLLLSKGRELCVCEFSTVLESIQPKISRHLAYLRKSGVVSDERRGQWVYYRLHPDLPKWAENIILVIVEELKKIEPYNGDLKKMLKCRKDFGC